jgi:hypothetical protein
VRFQLVLAVIAWSANASAQIINATAPDSFQVSYAANLYAGDSIINLTNDGASRASNAGGNLCVSVYAFDANEELLSCCTCTVTPNGLKSISVNNSLLGNTLTGRHPPSAVIELVATNASDSACNAYTEVTAAAGPFFAPGLRAWGTTLHALPTNPVTYQSTENPLFNSQLSEASYIHLTSFCAFITPTESNAGYGGQGVCASCQTGALGASTQL